MHELIKEALKEGLKQGIIEVVKDSLVWGVERIRDHYFPEAEEDEEEEDGEDASEDE